MRNCCRCAWLCSLFLILGLLGFSGISSKAFADDVVLISTKILPAGQTGVPYAAPVVAGDGLAPFRFYITASRLPAGLSLNASTGWISGTPSSAGTSYFTVEMIDAEGISVSANLSIVVNNGSNAALVPTYGAGVGSDGLCNTTIGPYEHQASYRFRATHSGNLTQAVIYLIPNVSGYAGGDGGKLLVSIKEDDGTSAHNPSSTTLATYYISGAASLPSPQRNFYVMKFSNQPWLNAGQIYHMTFQNVDPYPSSNFISVDSLYESSVQSWLPAVPRDPEAAVLMTEMGGPWKQRQGFSPIYQLEFSDGASEGNGYMEAWVGVPQNISGTVPLRENFTVTGPEIRVSSAAVRVARIRGGDPLVIRFENADGTVIEQGYVNAANIPLSSSSSPVRAWAIFNFSESHALVPGQTYHLVIECSSTSTYQAVAVQKGNYYGFQSTTFFADGRAETKVNNSWTGWSEWGVSNRSDDDLQFYMSVSQ